MPKLKTHKSAAKRIKVTSTGKMMRIKGERGHLRRKKAKRNSDKFDKMFTLAAGDAKHIKPLLPYGTP